MPAINLVAGTADPAVVLVTTHPCVVCGKPSTLTLDRAKVNRYIGGEFVQDVWPDMADADREVLVSGVHPACFDSLFPEED